MEIKNNEISNEELEFESEKMKLINELKVEITDTQSNLSRREIGTEEYDALLNKLNTLNKELNILMSINISNYEKKLNELSKIKEEFGYLTELDNAKLNELSKIMEEARNIGFFRLSKTVEVPDILLPEKESMQIRNIGFEEIENIDEIIKIMTMLDLQRQNLEADMDKLEKKYSEFVTRDFVIFYGDCEYGRVSRNYILESLRSTYPYSDSLINKILELKKELAELKNSVFGKNKFKEKREKTLELQRQLLTFISQYIILTFDAIREKIDSREKIEATDVFVNYSKTKKLAENKLQSINNLSADLLSFYTKYSIFEGRLLNVLRPFSIKDREDIEKISDLDRDKANTYISQINVYNKMSKLKKTDNYEEKKIMRVVK